MLESGINSIQLIQLIQKEIQCPFTTVKDKNVHELEQSTVKTWEWEQNRKGLKVTSDQKANRSGMFCKKRQIDLLIHPVKFVRPQARIVLHFQHLDASRCSQEEEQQERSWVK